jgi:hypothetical protein
MGVALANARLSLKVGTSVTVQDCMYYHNKVMGEFRGDCGDLHLHRHAQLVFHGGVACTPTAADVEICAHQFSATALRSAGLAMSVARDVELGPSHVSAVSMKTAAGYQVGLLFFMCPIKPSHVVWVCVLISRFDHI